jgi:hypothetical protein
VKVNNKKYLILLIVFSLLLGLGTSYKFNLSQEELPEGCDEFGYLNMAEAFRDNKVFEDHTLRPFIGGLIDTLKNENITEQEYLWMVVPHAYHFSAKTDYKIINQYAPGTSLVLSVFPTKYRQKVFPFLVITIALLMIILTSIFYLKISNYRYIIGVICFVGLVFHVSSPFVSEMARINSLGLTFGMFIAVGLLAQKKPLIAVFFIALASNFRLVNLLMLLPLSLFIIPLFINYIKNKDYRAVIVFILKGAFILLLGISFYLFYVTNLLGNPLLATYPDHDTSFGVFTNYYFDFKHAWFIVHVVLIVIMACFTFFKLMSIRVLLCWLSFPVVNYLFFSFHSIQMDYYPFASFFILLGAVINYTSHININKFYNKLLIVCSAIIVLFVVIDGVGRFMRKDHIGFAERVEIIDPLCSFDIVWGERINSTSEYICENSGFKYNYASSKSRVIALKYLKNNNYTQLLLCNDIGVEIDTIILELNTNNISFALKEMPTLGRVIIIN